MVCMAAASSCQSSRRLQALLQGRASLLLAVHSCGPPADRVVRGAAGLLPLERAGAGSPTLERRARGQVTCWEYFRPEEKGRLCDAAKRHQPAPTATSPPPKPLLNICGDCWAEEVGNG